MLIVDGGDCGQMRLERLHAAGFDRGLIHVGVVEVGDFAGVGARRRAGLRGLFNDGGDVFAAAIGEDGEDADAGAIGGNLGAGDPSAVGVAVEIVAGLDGAIDDWRRRCRAGARICNCGGALGVNGGCGDKNSERKDRQFLYCAIYGRTGDSSVSSSLGGSAKMRARRLAPRRRRGMIAREESALCALGG